MDEAEQARRDRAVGSISSATAALTLVLLDSRLAASWQPMFDEPQEDDLGGHPQRVIELLKADEDFAAAALKVGGGKALVLELEGATGEAEVYALPDGTLVLVEPTLSWWTDNFGRKVADVRALFEDAFDPTKKASPAAKVDAPSGKLVVFDANADPRPAAKSYRAKLAPGKVARLGRDDDAILIGVPPGAYKVRRRVIAPAWAKGTTLFVAYLDPGKRAKLASNAVVEIPPRKAPPKARSASKPSQPSQPKERKRSSVVFAPSPALAAIVGGRKEPMTLREVHAGIDAYIEKKALKDPKSYFWIVPDAKLKKVLLKDRVQVFEVPAIAGST